MAGMKKHSLTTAQIWLRSLIGLLIVAVILAGMLWLDSAWLLWVKAVHVIFVISWMAGMLYLPRLFVNHCTVAKGSEQSEIFKGMERRLLRYIINPSMVFVWITGLWMIIKQPWFLEEGWLHLKLTAVILLSAFHGFLARSTRHFAEDRNSFSQKTWRILNEVPTLLMIVAVIAVIALR